MCVTPSTDGHEVDITGTEQRTHKGHDNEPGDAPSAAATPVKPAPTKPRVVTLNCFQDRTCDGRGEPNTVNPNPNTGVAGADAEPERDVTIADLARYLPAIGALHAEPDGWAVVGVPANFWVEVEPVVVRGEVLDRAADVRFTPVGYRWAYGDGTTLTTETPGASWADLGQEELTRTATSHLYRARGTVDATVTVLYTAEYRFAGGAWIPVDGAVEAESPPAPTLVVVEHTVLTNG